MVKKKPTKKPDAELLPETDAEVLEWAKQVKAAAGIEGIRLLITQYRQITRNPKATKYDRQVARQRLKILSGIK